MKYWKSGDDADQSSFNWQTSILIILGWLPGFMALSIVQPILPDFEQAIAKTALDYQLVKMVVVIAAFGIVAAGPLSGRIITRYGARSVMIYALSIFAIVGCLPFILTNLFLILLSRFILGVAAALIPACCLTVLGASTGADTRAKFIGYMTSATSLGSIALRPLSGLVGSVGGWRAPFLLYALALLVLPLAIYGLRGVQAATVEKSLAAPTAPYARTDFPWGVLCVAFVVGLIVAVAPLYFAFRLRDVGVMRASTIGLSYLALNLPELISSGYYGTLKRTFTTTAIYVAGFGLCAAGLMVVALASSHVLVLLGMAMCGCGMVHVSNNVLNAAAENSLDRSRQVGLVLSAIFGSLVVGPIILSALFHGHGAVDELLVIASVSFAAATWHASRAVGAGQT